MSEVYGLSARAADRLALLLNEQPGGSGPSGRGSGSRIRFVKCLSATAVGGAGVLAECYPAQVIEPAGDKKLPAETGGLVLLTLIGSDSNPAVPTANASYLCVITGDAAGDESGSGSARVAGRPRAFGIASSSSGGSGDVVGPASATDAAIVLYNGTTGKLIKNSVVTINGQGTGAGNAGISGSYGYGYFGYYATDTSGVGTKQVILQTSISPYSSPGLSVNNNSAISYLINNGGSWQAIVPLAGTFTLSGAGTGTQAAAYAITRGTGSSPTYWPGIDTTFTVKVGGVDKTVTVYGGIIVGIA